MRNTIDDVWEASRKYMALKDRAKDPEKAKLIDRQMRESVDTRIPLENRVNKTLKAIRTATRKMRRA